MLTPFDVIVMYCLCAPIILSGVMVVLLFLERPQINIQFPKVLLCGKTDHLGTSIDIQGNGMLAVMGAVLPKNKYVLVVEVTNGI